MESSLTSKPMNPIPMQYLTVCLTVLPVIHYLPYSSIENYIYVAHSPARCEVLEEGVLPPDL